MFHDIKGKMDNLFGAPTCCIFGDVNNNSDTDIYIYIYIYRYRPTLSFQI